MTPNDRSTTAGFSATDRASLSNDVRQPLTLCALTILTHPDPRRVGERTWLGELSRGAAAELSRYAPTFASPEGGAERPLGDRAVSRQPLTLSSAGEGVVELSAGRSRTRVAVDGVRVSGEVRIPAAALDLGVVLTLAERIVLLLHRHTRGPTALRLHGLVGASDAIARVRHSIETVAELQVPVLLRGETGTGKELVAQALHRSSSRTEGPFVSVNVGALAPTLAASELFGALKGSFTGAEHSQQGYFVRAHGGTLLLDEIGEAPPEVQVMLLRALETGEISPVGAQRTRHVDVRVISATDADLEALVGHGGFRAPLLHRLAAFEIQLPPLRERRDDLGRLLLHFLTTERRAVGDEAPEALPDSKPWLSAALMTRLALHGWPGNVRELRNVARSIAIHHRGQACLDDFPGLKLSAPQHSLSTPSSRPGPRRRKPATISDEEMLDALKEHHWNLTAAARALGIPRTSLYSRIERSTVIRTAADLSAQEIRASFDRNRGVLVEMVDDLGVSERGLRQRLKDLGLRG